MRFRSKISNLLLHIATTAVIILSLVLWIFVMTNDERFSHFSQQPRVSRDKINQRSYKSLRELYLPTRTYGYEKGKVYQLYDSKHNLPLEFSKEFISLHSARIKSLGMSQSRYQSLLYSRHYIQLTYPDQITVSLLSQIIKSKKDYQFNRIFLPEQSNDYLYLGNDLNNRIYRLRVKNGNFASFRRFTHHAQQRVEVSFVKLRQGYFAFYRQNFNTNVYSYLVNHQDNSYFVSRLLGTNNVVSRTNHKGRTTYSAGYNSRLRVPKAGRHAGHNYLYTHYDRGRIPSATGRFLDSIYYVHQIGLMEQDLRFFDADNGVVYYTNFVEGLPVMLNNDTVQVQVKFNREGVSSRFNSVNLQIPIPANGEQRLVPATSTVIERLSSKGLNQNNIQKIVLGLKTVSDKKQDLVILEPTYYIKAFDQWHSASEWQQIDISSLAKQNLNSRRNE